MADSVGFAWMDGQVEDGPPVVLVAWGPLASAGIRLHAGVPLEASSLVIGKQTRKASSLNWSWGGALVGRQGWPMDTSRGIMVEGQIETQLDCESREACFSCSFS